MTMTDPIADMLTRIRNANVAMHDEVRMPVLQAEGGPRRAAPEGGLHRGLRPSPTTPSVPGQRASPSTMKYSPERERVISGVKRVSKPGLRVYTKADEIPASSAASVSPSCPPARGS